MTKVVHCRKEPYDVYIGRPSIWGNPYTIGIDGNRKEVIEKYRSYILNNPELYNQLHILKNKTLGCWCKPKPCHGDILMDLLDNITEIQGDMFQFAKDYDALCITTNGMLKVNGACVMGKGCAKAVKHYVPHIDHYLGQKIRENGNRVYFLGNYNIQGYNTGIISFPTKHKWYDDSDIELIRTSATQLIELMNERGMSKVLLPRPGCQNGNLKWKEVKPVLEGVLDNRVTIISKQSLFTDFKNMLQ